VREAEVQKNGGGEIIPTPIDNHERLLLSAEAAAVATRTTGAATASAAAATTVSASTATITASASTTAVSASAATTTVSATATTGGTFFARTRDIHGEATTGVIFAVHAGNRGVRLIGRRHGHEREAARAACDAIGDQGDVCDGAMGRKGLFEFFICGGERKVPHI
jgi:hypothetical protein